MSIMDPQLLAHAVIEERLRTPHPVRHPAAGPTSSSIAWSRVTHAARTLLWGCEADSVHAATAVICRGPAADHAAHRV